MKRYEPAFVELESTDDYLRKIGSSMPGQLWHGMSPGVARLNHFEIVEPETDCEMDLLVFHRDNELVGPIPLHILRLPNIPGQLSYMVPGKPILLGLTRKAKAVILHCTVAHEI